MARSNVQDDLPRPAKRQRTTRPKADTARKRNTIFKESDISAEFIYDSDSDGVVRTAAKSAAKPATRPRSGSISSDGPVKPARKRAAVRKPKDSATPGRQKQAEAVQSDDEDAFEPVKACKVIPRAVRIVDEDEDSEGKSKIKKPKHRIHEPAALDRFRPIFVSQAPPPASSDPANLRGEIWIKQPEPRPPPTKPHSPLKSLPAFKPAVAIQNSAASKPATVMQAPPRPSLTVERREQTAPLVLPTPSREPTTVFTSTTNGASRFRQPNESLRNDRFPPGKENVPVGLQKLCDKTANMVPPPTSIVAHTALTDPDILNELADLPSDAFSTDGEDEFNPAPLPNRAPHAPSQSALGTGYRQMTLHGSFSAPNDGDQSRAKKTAWPLSERNEKPTQHQLNADALSTWVYPTNLGIIRDYQYNIVHTGLFHNLLVALPTGLGKTFIAATIMLNWYRWTKDAQIVFVAPTKPLVAQQVDACFHTVGIPRSSTAMLTGTINPVLRKDAWDQKRVFFMTPQTMANDLKSGICDPKRLVLLVVDEAHRATGNYSYVDIVRFVRRFNPSFRVLALTATPGAKIETVQQVIDGLDISRVEIRTESSLDIRQYVHARETEVFKFDYSDEQDMVMDLFSKAVKPVLDQLNSQNAYWLKDPTKLTAFGLTQAQRQWAGSEAGRGASQIIKGMVRSSFSVLSSLAHAMTMLKFHGISPFFRKIAAFKKEVDEGKMKMKAALRIRNNENFNKLCNRVQGWVNNPDFIGHPKLEFLREVILNHFLDAGEGNRANNAPCTTRVMVFAQYRDSAEQIARVLKRNEMIRPHVFVGQAAAEGSAGMDQKTQLDVIEHFKAGTFNTLVATSIGEEGLDIGEVDLIICYDANASPIRMLQRMGRTGRKRKGKIVLLLMRDKEERDFEAAKDAYEKMQGMIASGKHFDFHDDRSPRILPKDVKPVVEKRVVEIPVENSQADLPMPTKGRRKKKMPPKKFHMPDGVITGFVKASRVRGDGSDAEVDEEEPAAAPKKGSRKSIAKSNAPAPPPPEPEAVPLPFLQDVLLNKMQERELARKYQYVTATDEASACVRAPMPEKNLEGFRNPGPASIVQHGRYTMAIGSMLERMHDIDGATMERWREGWHDEDLVEGPASLDTLQVKDPVGQEDASGSDDDLPSQLPVVARAPTRGRGGRSNPAARTAPKQAPKQPPKQPPKRGRGNARAAKGRSRPSRSSDMEGDFSSPEPTPRDFAMPSQAETIGSADTSGDEAQDPEAWRDDSDLEDFVAGSDSPTAFASSSAGVLGLIDPSSPIILDDSDSDLPEAIGKADKAAARKRKRVVDSDSDD